MGDRVKEVKFRMVRQFWDDFLEEKVVWRVLVKPGVIR